MVQHDDTGLKVACVEARSIATVGRDGVRERGGLFEVGHSLLLHSCDLE